MSASLVGSEMCIRDSNSPNGPNDPLHDSESANIGAPLFRAARRKHRPWPVSYTHLTLPTICSV
eukprot:8377170-Alexandrium_andersonii.AAC.1